MVVQNTTPNYFRLSADLDTSGIQGLPATEVWLDVTTTFDVNSSLAITSHPVQYLADISDHRTIQPRTFQLAGYIIDPIINEQTGLVGETDKLWAERIADLEYLKNSGIYVKMQTPEFIFKNLLIESFTFSQESRYSGNATLVNISLREVLTSSVSTQIIKTTPKPKRKKRKPPKKDPNPCKTKLESEGLYVMSEEDLDNYLQSTLI